MADNKTNRSILNTTIDKDVMDNFRAYCKTMGCPMNVILEAFMTQFAQGQFVIKLGKSAVSLDLDE